MRYASNEAHAEFIGGEENFGTPLAKLEESFKAAGIDVEFVCCMHAPGDLKKVSIYKGGLYRGEQFIEGDSPAAAVKDVAAVVKV
jgi:hypothetical protein